MNLFKHIPLIKHEEPGIISREGLLDKPLMTVWFVHLIPERYGNRILCVRGLQDRIWEGLVVVEPLKPKPLNLLSLYPTSNGGCNCPKP